MYRQNYDVNLNSKAPPYCFDYFLALNQNIQSHYDFFLPMYKMQQQQTCSNCIVLMYLKKEHFGIWRVWRQITLSPSLIKMEYWEHLKYIYKLLTVFKDFFSFFGTRSPSNCRGFTIKRLNKKLIYCDYKANSVIEQIKLF